MSLILIFFYFIWFWFNFSTCCKTSRMNVWVLTLQRRKKNLQAVKMSSTFATFYILLRFIFFLFTGLFFIIFLSSFLLFYFVFFTCHLQIPAIYINLNSWNFFTYRFLWRNEPVTETKTKTPFFFKSYSRNSISDIKCIPRRHLRWNQEIHELYNKI